MPEELWTGGDIADRLGISVTLVANWGRPGARKIPEPHAQTVKGMRLWTTEQAEQICNEYTDWRQARDARAADKERADRMLQLLSA